MPCGMSSFGNLAVPVTKSRRRPLLALLMVSVLVMSLVFASDLTYAGNDEESGFVVESSQSSIAPRGGMLSDLTLVASSTVAFTVNTTDDADDSTCDGIHCSLREAINESNLDTSFNLIDFDIAGVGPHTIIPGSALPIITDPVFIDGFSQLGASPNTKGTDEAIDAVLKIELDGSNAGDGVSGLQITAGGSTVRGLVINRFGGSGISLETNGGNAVTGNFIGTDVTGTTVTGVSGPALPSLTVTVEPESSGTYPVGTDKTAYVSQTSDPTGPWSGNAVHFLGWDVGGSQEQFNDEYLVYRYRLDFASDATLTSVSVSGAAFNGGGSRIRVLDENKNVLGQSWTFGGNSSQKRIVNLSSVVGDVFFVEEFDDSTNWRYRDHLEINGPTLLGNGFEGVSIASGSSGNVVGGDTPADRNLISGNNHQGVNVLDPGSDSNSILGNFIGTDATGTLDLGNRWAGVLIELEASDNLVGGDTAAERNLLSGNDTYGVSIASLDATSTSGNAITGNYIGTERTGSAALGNSIAGVYLREGARDNTVGGSAAGAGNVISGNNTGVLITDKGTDSNTVLGNFIGTDVTGHFDVGNRYDGVDIRDEAQFNTVGGFLSGDENLISGNRRNGVLIRDGGSTDNLIAGNLIGTDVTGSAALGNGDRGVAIWSGAQRNSIDGNVISGNDHSGVILNNAGTDFNTISNNYIGTNMEGTSALPNGWEGIIIWDGPQQNVIGGSLSSGANVISGNASDGIGISRPGSDHNVVSGNFIGTDKGGSYEIPNGDQGVHINDGAQFNIIGSDEHNSDERNIISGNNESGVAIQDSGADFNVVTGNYIGTTVDGIDPLGNGEFGVDIRDGAQNNIVGGDGGEGNVISGNTNWGVVIRHDGADNNRISANFVGTDPTGTSALPNLGGGVAIWGGAQNNIIGGDTLESQGNVISGNDNDGVGIGDPDTTGNVVSGNLIGIDTTGLIPLGNRYSGIAFWNGAEANIIGGTTEGERNIISANGDNGIVMGDGSNNNIVSGNYIGTDVSGTVSLGNLNNGVAIHDGSFNNIVGGSVPGAANVISGNETGIDIRHEFTSGNHVRGNVIGLDYTGTFDLGNAEAGVRIADGANRNVVGVTSSTIEGNVISGNGRGVEIENSNTSDNHVQGNYIGTDTGGTFAIGNSFEGVAIFDSPGNTIGGPNELLRNVISGNGISGVYVGGANSSGNDVVGNFIGTDISGTQDIGNVREGIILAGGSANDNSIGGSAPGAGNVIAFNGAGVRIEDGVGNNLNLNSFFSNDGIGIDLNGFDGRTFNDAGDGDAGANNQQNFPEDMSALIEASGDLVIEYLVDSDTGNSAYPLLIEFYVADSDGEEGKTHIASDSYLAAAAHSSRSINLGNSATLGVLPGSPIVATATDVDGNTSEFSDATVAGALITTFAGIGPGFGGDGGNATGARLSHPQRLAMDDVDNLYIADKGNHRVRMVTPAGVITTVAGDGEAGYSGDGGPATNARLNAPTGLDVDDVNNVLYIADSLNNRVRAVDLNTGDISTVAGDGTGTFSVSTFATDVIAESPSHGSSDELLGAPDGNFASFDDDGSQAGFVTVAFNDGLILDGPGDDLAIHLFDFPEWEDEDFEVFVSDDGSSFVSLGVVIPINDEGGVYETEYFDISSSGLTSASHVKIVNVRFDLDDEFEGPEIDAIEALNTDKDIGATSTGLNQPTDVAVNSAGDNLYIADRHNHSVRSVDLDTGFITNYAGTGDWGFSGDGIPAVDAELNQPMGLGIDAGGNLYIADRWNHRIRRVDVSTGVITTVAGDGNGSFGGDGGPATDAQLNEPADVSFDSAGNMFIADRNRNRRIRKVDTGGIINTIAGDGPIGPDGDNGDGGPATAARLWNPVGVAVDSIGNVLISDTSGHRVRRVDASTDVITTYAGTDPPGFSGDGGLATNALLNTPTKVATDAQDNLYITDRFNHRIRMVDTDGIITTVAGNGTPTGFIDGEGGNTADDLGDNALAVDATINNAIDIAVDATGNLYIADSNNLRIRKVDTNGVITTVAGNGIQTGSIDGEGGDPSDDLGDGGQATDATFAAISGIDVDVFGNLFIADSFGGHRIRKVDAVTGIITTVVGDGNAGFCGDGGPATSACLNAPVGVAINNVSGDLYIAERNNFRVRKVDSDTGIITTVAGKGGCCFDGDGGLATEANLHNPYDIEFDAAGNMFIADFLNMRVRRVDAVSGIITTVAGSGSSDEIDSSFSGDGGPATEAEMTVVLGLALDSQGNLFIPDMLNHVVRKVHGVGEPSNNAKVVTLSGEDEAVRGGQYFVLLSAPGAVSASVGPLSEPMTPIGDVPEILVRMHGLGSVGGADTTHVWLGNAESGPIGLRDVEITIVDSGSVTRTLTTQIEILSLRSNRNYFLMPGTNYVGLGQIPDDTDLDALFAQPVPNANPAFEAELGRPVTLADVVEKVFAFSDAGSFLTFFTEDPITGDAGPSDTLTDLASYQGMIIMTRESVIPSGGGAPIDVFHLVVMSGQSDSQAVPIKMTIEGSFLDVGGSGPVTPISKMMRFTWNLVAPHVQESALFEEVFSNALEPERLTSSAITYMHLVAASSVSGIDALPVNEFKTVNEGGEITPEHAYWIYIADTGDPIDQPVMVPQASP